MSKKYVVADCGCEFELGSWVVVTCQHLNTYAINEDGELEMLEVGREPTETDTRFRFKLLEASTLASNAIYAILSNPGNWTQEDRGDDNDTAFSVFDCQLKTGLENEIARYERYRMLAQELLRRIDIT